MVKILGIVIAVIGIIMFVNGVRAFLGRLKMKENDRISRFYVGIQGVAAGLGAIFLGITLYLTQ